MQALLKLREGGPSFQNVAETHLHHVVQASDSAGRIPFSAHSRRLNEHGHAAIAQEAQQLHQNNRAPRDSNVSAGAVFVLTILMASASCLGAVPFFFVGTLSTRWSALANAIACGVMLAASFDLIHEGEPYGGGLVIIGITVGEAMHQYLLYHHAWHASSTMANPLSHFAKQQGAGKHWVAV